MVMKRHNAKRLIAVVLLIMIALYSSFAYSADAIPEATKNFYVNDYAGIFSTDQINEMMQRAVNLANKPEGVQVVVSTVKNLGGMSVEDYANSMYNKFKIGRDDKGILIIISIQERKVRMEVGYGLESYMNDSKAGKFLQDYAISYLKKNQFDLGILSLQKAVVEDLDAHFEKARATATPKVRPTDVPIITAEPVTRASVESSDQEIPAANKTENGFINWMAFGVSVFAVLLFVLFIIQTVKLHKSEENRDYESNEYDKKLRSRDSTIQSLRSENSQKDRIIDDEKSKYERLSKKYEQLNDRFVRAGKLHKGLDQEIDDMIQREIDEENRRIAAKFDEKYGVLATDEPLNQYLKLGPKGFNSFKQKYDEAFDAYEALSKERKQYVKTNMTLVRKYYDSGLLQKSKDDAKALNTELTKCQKTRKGKEENLDYFKKLHKEYDDMDEQTQGFVDASLITSLGMLISYAKKDRDERIAREEEEEAERRRQAAMSYHYYSSSSYSSSSSHHSSDSDNDSNSTSIFDFGGGFDGFGGSSGGGGASADF